GLVVLEQSGQFRPLPQKRSDSVVILHLSRSVASNRTIASKRDASRPHRPSSNRAAIVHAPIVFAPCHLVGVGVEVGAGDLMMDADFRAADAGDTDVTLNWCEQPLQRNSLRVL